jgi:hypothetical protein
MYYNPYGHVQSSGQWLKTNFHTHAGTGAGTCGAYDIDDVISLYQEAGYGALTISNHDILSKMTDYQSRYDMVLVPGFEYSQDLHMLCIGVEDMLWGKHQEVIHQCNGEKALCILAHPNWQRKEYWPWETIDALHGYTGIEIFNSLIFRLNGSGLATDTWDHLLSQGKRVWGFAHDDFHRWYDLAKAWNVIHVTERTPEGVIASVEKGAFYTSTGLILQEIDFQNNHISIRAGAKDTYIQDNLYRFIGKDGEILAEQTGSHGEYHLTGDELYVRIQVISEHGAMLWTQPLYRLDAFHAP